MGETRDLDARMPGRRSEHARHRLSATRQLAGTPWVQRLWFACSAGFALGGWIFAPLEGGDLGRVVYLGLVAGNLWMMVEILHIFEWRVQNTLDRRQASRQVPRHVRDMMAAMALMMLVVAAFVISNDGKPIMWFGAPPASVVTIWILVRLHAMRRFQADMALREIVARDSGLRAVRDVPEHSPGEQRTEAEIRQEGRRRPTKPAHLT